MVMYLIHLNDIISTHAPAGGATVDLLSCIIFILNFYSRPCGRGDGEYPLRWTGKHLFLLTPLREGRPVP